MMICNVRKIQLSNYDLDNVELKVVNLSKELDEAALLNELLENNKRNSIRFQNREICTETSCRNYRILIRWII